MLDWISVGKLAAERDDNLSQYFVDNGVLANVLQSPSSFLVLGRKGAGKTAVFNFLKQNPGQFLGATDLLVSLTFEDYNWNVHSLLQNPHAAESLTYKDSWRFVIYVEALKALNAWTTTNNIKLPKAATNALKVINSLFDSPEPSIYQLVGRKLLSLSKVKLPSVGIALEDGTVEANAGEVSFEEVKEQKSLQESLSNNIAGLIEMFERAVEECNVLNCKVFITFDRVDEAWDDVSFDVSRRVIAGLVSAADSITSKCGGQIRPIVFLREDIFEVLSLNDLNKLREDCGALLHWDSSSLFRLILARVNFFAQRAGVKPVDDIDDLFDKKEMRQRARPSTYLLRRTMMRPRDLISFINRVIESMREAAVDPFVDEEAPLATSLSTDAIYDAEPGYSEWLRAELTDEWAVQNPMLRAQLDVLRSHGSTNITRDEFEIGLRKQGVDATTQVVDDALRFLFDNSVIGFKVGQSTIWKFKCVYPSQGFVPSDLYHVHDGLVRGLGLKEPREA